MCPGGVRRDLPPGFEEKLAGFIHTLASHVPDFDAALFENRIFYERAKGVGKITREEALELGATGQVLRATGLPYDIRKVEPYLVYDRLNFEVPTREGGDAYSRLWVIHDEMIQSAHIIMQCLEKMPSGKVFERTPNPFKWRIPKGETYVRVESSRGELGCYMVSNGGKNPYRVHFRTPSFTHGLPILEKLLKGANISDVGNIMISLYVVAPEIDR